MHDVLVEGEMLPLMNNLADPVFDGVRLAVSRARPMLFYWPQQQYPYYVLPLFFPSFRLLVGIVGAGIFRLIGCMSLSLSVALPTSFNNNIKIIKSYIYS